MEVEMWQLLYFPPYKCWGLRSVTYVWCYSHPIRSSQQLRMSWVWARTSSRERWANSPTVWWARSFNSTKSSKHESGYESAASSLPQLRLYLSPPSCHLPRLEWEQLLEHHRVLQDSFDQLQAEAKFEADQAKQQLQDRQQEIDDLETQLMVSDVIISITTLF